MWCRPLDVSAKSALHKYTRHTRPVLPRMPPPGMEVEPAAAAIERNETKQLLPSENGPRKHVAEKMQAEEAKQATKN